MSTPAEYLGCLEDGKTEDQGKSGSPEVIGGRQGHEKKTPRRPHIVILIVKIFINALVPIALIRDRDRFVRP